MSHRKVITGSVVKGVSEPGWTQLQVYDRFFRSGSALIKRIDEFSMLRQSVVTSALDVLAQDVSKATLGLVIERRNEIRVIEPDEHPLARRLRLEPNPHQTWMGFWMQVIPYLAMHQVAYIYQRRRNMADMDPDLVAIHPSMVTVNASPGGFTYDCTAETAGDEAMLGFLWERLTDDDLIRIVGRTRNGWEGLSTIMVGADVLGLNAMMVEFQAAIAKGGLKPNGVISVPEKMDDEAFARLKNQIITALSAAVNKGDPLVLEQNAEWKDIGATAEQADLVKARQQLAQEVARLFRMPPHKVGLLESVKYDNLETMEKNYVDDTIVPICVLIEQHFTRALLTEKERLAGYAFRFDREELYDRDPAARRERIEKQFQSGLLWLNEARALLGKTPVPAEQDHRVLPLNSAIIYRSGEIEKLSGAGPKPEGDPPPPAKSASRAFLN